MIRSTCSTKFLSGRGSKPIGSCCKYDQLLFWGVLLLLISWASNYLAEGAGPSQQGRPTLSASMVMPSFVFTFAMPAMSLSTCTTSIFSLLNGAPCDFANCSAVLAMDQLCIVGPGFSSVPAKLVTQIEAGKYIDLSNLLPVNLVQKELEPQLLLDVLTS